ncbi:MAG: adenosylcobalamin-dependent ribonucleoside-diphosphate reductase [Zetaproteobacteria bacterium]|nr:adenosylcobalamin-dependent ribonucleoside-diphosphate reductase [Zetaproteobacteria bacterium]
MNNKTNTLRKHLTHLEKEHHHVPLQDASLDIWDKKYRLKDKQGNPIDMDIHDTHIRVAKALSDVETEQDRQYWFSQFTWALDNGAIPAGRIISNAGANEHKPATSTINCTVSGIIPDSMDGILSMVKEAGLTLKAGCGIGYEFSTLRPKGAYVKGAGAFTSGPMSFMDIYDKMCFTVSSAGGRRGAQMGTFDIHHPDITDFVLAKRENGRLRQFNLSCLISKDFMEAVKNDSDWPLIFPATISEANDEKNTIIFHHVANPPEGSIQDDRGLTACRVYKTIKAKRLWDVIMTSTYDFAEPGFILIDRVNEMNNNWFCEDIRATNPCGEQPLPPYGACLLGSVNLTNFVRHPFTEKATFDWENYSKVVSIFTRMLDNVIEINGLPLEEQREELARKRRHGMGFLGLGSALAMLKVRYGSQESLEFTERVAYEMARIGFRVGVELAKEKGAAPLLDEEFTITPSMLRKKPQLINDGLQVGDTVTGRLLWSKYSSYLQQFSHTANDEDKALLHDLETYGCRFTHHSSIAPTGTISLSLANNASNGIEPSFAHHYARNIIREGKKSKEKVDVFSYELLAYREFINKNAMPFSEDKDQQLPDYFINADAVTPKQHVDIQAAAQIWIDSSISKTANVPTDFSYDDFKDIYLYAYEKGLKGCTTFRFNPEVFQGVLVKEEDLANTTYRFTLEDGETVEVKGNEEIEYDGEMHSAANLFDALKEGYYGKF